MVTTCMLTRFIRSTSGISMVKPGSLGSRLGPPQPKYHAAFDLLDDTRAGAPGRTREHGQRAQRVPNHVHDDSGYEESLASSVRRSGADLLVHCAQPSPAAPHAGLPVSASAGW